MDKMPKITAVVLSQGIQMKGRQFSLINVFNRIYADKIEGTFDLYITVLGENFKPGTKIDLRITVYYNDEEKVLDSQKLSVEIKDEGYIMEKICLKEHIPFKKGTYKVEAKIINITESHASFTAF